jgi:hypothetical protein
VSFSNYDLFDWFRFALAWVVGVYATVITVQSLWEWYVWLAGQDKYIGMLRRYLVVHGLRLRVGTFWGDVAVCALLTIAFFMIWHAHHLIYDLGEKLGDQRVSRVMQSRQTTTPHVAQPAQR